MADQYILTGTPTSQLSTAEELVTILPPGGSVSSGQNNYDTGTGFWLGNDGGTPKFSIGSSSGNKLTWNGSTLSITGSVTATTGTIGGWTIGATTITGGNVTLDSTGNIRAGQTAYNTGTGFWLGVDSGTPKFSIGNPSGTAMSWDGTSLTMRGTIAIAGGGLIIDGGDFTVQKNSTAVSTTLLNLSSNGLAEISLILQVSGSSTQGDPRTQYKISGTTTWSTGIDNSDSDSFKISNSADLGSSNALTITTSGNTTVAGTLTVSGTGTSSFAGLNSLFGSTSISTFSGNATPKLQVVGTTNFYESSFGLVRYASGGNVPSVGPFCYLALSRGTAGSHTVVQDGDLVGGFTFEGSDGDQFLGVAQIRALVDGTPGNNDMPGRLQFWTCADGAGSPRVVVEIRQNADVVLNATGSALATTATGGFTYIPTCAGTPTGTPTNLPTGALPMVIDSTNNRLYFYSGGAWRNAGP